MVFIFTGRRGHIDNIAYAQNFANFFDFWAEFFIGQRLARPLHKCQRNKGLIALLAQRSISFGFGLQANGGSLVGHRQDHGHTPWLLIGRHTKFSEIFGPVAAYIVDVIGSTAPAILAVKANQAARHCLSCKNLQLGI